MLVVFKRATIALAIGGTMFAPAAPAAHATSLGNPLGGTTTTVSLGHNLSASITLTPVPTSLNGYSVVASCEAVATPDPSSTTITACSVDGVGIGSQVSLPGPTAAAATVVTAFRNSTVSACIGASAQFVESILGPGTLTAGPTCFGVRLP
jgi:hypothetical protein